MASSINSTSTGNGGLVSTGDDSGILNIQTNEITAITVDASQNVGIGVTPSAWTSANVAQLGARGSVWYYSGGSMHMSLNSYSVAGVDKYIQTDTAADYYQYAGGHFFRYAASGTAGNNISWTTGMTLDSSGNFLLSSSLVNNARVSIGCASGTQSIAFAIGSGVTRASGTQYGYSLYRDNTNETSAVTFVENNSTGNNAASYVVRSNAATGGTGVTNVSGGVALVNGATSWSSYSDLRLKHDVVPVTNALESILKIDPIFFKWNDRPEDQPRSIGVSAQSVEKVFPELIDRSGVYDVEGGAMQVRYTELIPVLLKSIQELKAINDTQAETINALTARIVALEQA